MNFWPFKDKNKINLNPNSLNTENLTRNRRRRSIGLIITAAFLSLGTFGGTAVGITISALKYQTDGEFKDGYNIRFQLNTTQLEDPTNVSTWDSETLQKMVDKSANAYSSYLLDQGISTFNVYPEFISKDQSKSGNDEAYISAIVPKKQVLDPDSGSAKTKIDEPPTSVYMDDITSNRLSMLLVQTDGTSDFEYSIINQEDIVNDTGKDNFTVNSGNQKQIDIHLKYSFKNTIDNYFKKPDSVKSTDNPPDKKSEIYFIRDINGLISRMNYDLQARWLYENPINSSDAEIYNLLPDEDKSFVDAYIGSNQMDESMLHIFNNTDYDPFSPDSNKQSIPKKPMGIGGDFYKWIDWKWDGIDYNLPSYSQNDSDLGVPRYFTGDYVLGVATAKNIDDFFPTKNPKNKHDTNRDWLTVRLSSDYKATQAVNNYNKLSTSLVTSILSSDDAKNDNIISKISQQINITNPSLKKNMFDFNALLGMVIALVIATLIIGVVVSVLYRIPGLFAFGAMLLTLSLSLMTLLLTGYSLSLGLLVGLFVAAIISLIVTLGFNERIKRQLKNDVKFNAALRLGLKKGMWPAIDLCFVLLIIGIICVYMGSLTLNQFSMTLVISSLFILGIMVFIYPLICYLFFNNGINLERQKLMFSNKVKPVANELVINNRPIVTSFDNVLSLKNIRFFNTTRFIALRNKIASIKPNVIISCIFLALIIAGIVVIFTVGIHTSYTFFGGTRLILNNIAYNYALTHGWIGNNFSLQDIVTQSDGSVIYYIYYDHTLSDAIIASIHAMVKNDNTSLAYVQEIAIGGVSNYLTSIVYIILSCSGIIAAYALVRLNWTAMIPTFIAIVLLPLLIVGIVAIGQIYINTNVVLALLVIYTINVCIVLNTIATIKNSTIKQQIFTYSNLKIVIKKELTNSLMYIFYISILTILGLTSFLLLTSINLIWFFAISMIAIIIMIIFAYSTLVLLLTWFIAIRYKYLHAQATRLSDGMINKSYDVIDEQLIEGMNQFRRKRIVI